MLQQHNAVIQEQVAAGIVVPIPAEEDDCSNANRLHYLQHHAVVAQDKTTSKRRVVYDASAKTNGPSLNGCLHVSPALHCNYC